MCTLTWRTEEGLEVFFNRDELKTRGRAQPPAQRQAADGTNYLAPIDPDAGGTWMLANEYGLVVCLLNRWHVPTQPSLADPSAASRGKVVLELASVTGLTEIRERLSRLAPGAKPFELVAFFQGQRVAFSWDGQTLSSFEPRLPLTSSSFQFEKVKAARENAFVRSSSLEQFQSTQDEDSSAYTVRMNRPDAQTWSRSHLQVTTDRVVWHYWEEFLNLSREPKLHQIELARRSL